MLTHEHIVQLDWRRQTKVDVDTPLCKIRLGQAARKALEEIQHGADPLKAFGDMIATAAGGIMSANTVIRTILKVLAEDQKK